MPNKEHGANNSFKRNEKAQPFQESQQSELE